MKSICLAYETAAAFWQSRRAFVPGGLSTIPTSVSPNAFSASKVSGDRIRTTGLIANARPIHVLLPRQRRRSSTEDLHIHVPRAELPDGSFHGVEEGVFACSPELCFVQMASQLPFLELVVLGMRLCGCYSVDDTSPKGFFRHPAATSTTKIATYLDACPPMHGTTAARRALAYVADGASSPMEAKIALMLALPSRMGGFGLTKPQLNARIQLSEVAARNLGTKVIRPDLYWVAFRLALEYDSTLAHVNAVAIERDARRRRSYDASEITVIPVTSADVENYAAFRRIVVIIRHHMGSRDRGESTTLTTKRKQLFHAIFFARHDIG